MYIAVLRWIERTHLIYIVMFILILWGSRYLILLYGYKRDFELANKKLKDATVVSEIQDWLCGKSEHQALLNSRTAPETFKEYCTAYQRNLQTKATSPFLDITEYFNNDWLDEACGTGICDVIPGALTGFGILGTFVGLVLGISGFDTASADIIIDSISTLLAGMNTAFSTSIIGVFLSLLFSIFHRNIYESTNSEMESFTAAFHDTGLDGSDNTPEGQLLSYQQQQTALMENLATVISDSISNTMKTELLPVFERMEHTIEMFSDVASQQQTEGLQQVVQKFIGQMNDSLGNQFEALGETLKELCEWQKNASEQMQKIVDDICDTSGEIHQVNDLSRQTVQEMQEFVSLLKEYQEQLGSESELVRVQIEKSNEISQRQADYIDTLVASEERIASLADHVKAEADAVQQTVDKMAEYCQHHINLISDASKENMQELSKATEHEIQGISTAANQMTVEISDSMQGIAKAVEHEADGLSNIASQTTSEMKAACSSMEQAAKLLDKNLDQVLEQTFVTFDNSLSDITQHLSGTIADVRDATEALPHVIREAQKQYGAVLEELTEQTQRYAVIMGSIAGQLEENKPQDVATNREEDEEAL